MQILLIGHGGREHALAWKLHHSPLLGHLYSWPGNAAMAPLAEPLPLADKASYEQLAAVAKDHHIDLVICGPEVPLARGLHDSFAALGLRVFGPHAAAAQLEASKAFAKEIMAAAAIPTARFTISYSREESEALAVAELTSKGRVVLKASGLASGKGVVVCANVSEVREALQHLYSADLATASTTLVIEEFLTGRECSYFSLRGPRGHKSLGFAVDFKRLLEGDGGPNTGGMGAYAPVPWLPADAAAQVEALVITPLMKAMAERGLSYQGFLYVGLMWTAEGPVVIEFNVRLGDPEAQVLVRQDDRDWLALVLQVLGLSPWREDDRLPRDKGKRSVAVVMADASYPLSSSPLSSSACEWQGEGLPRSLFPQTPLLGEGDDTQLLVFGGALEPGTPKTLTPGRGRVLTVVARGASFHKARDLALAGTAQIGRYWPHSRWRQDIAARAAREEGNTFTP